MGWSPSFLVQPMIVPVLTVLGIYLLAGFLFGFAFAFFGARSIDPSAAAGTWGFKLLIIPGCAIFWPYLLQRWLTKRPPPDEQSTHRRAANF